MRGGTRRNNLAERRLAVPAGGEESSMGLPTPATLEDLEVFFYSLAGVAVTGKGVLGELVKSNASLTITIANLTYTNARLSKKVETLTAAMAKKEEAEERCPAGNLANISLTAKGKHGTIWTSGLS